jgi:hypothetical protein
MAWFSSFLLPFSFFFTILVTVLTELGFHDIHIKLWNDENIYVPGTGLSQTH